jgi:hypothetical protein
MFFGGLGAHGGVESDDGRRVRGKEARRRRLIYEGSSARGFCNSFEGILKRQYWLQRV